MLLILCCYNFVRFFGISTVADHFLRWALFIRTVKRNSVLGVVRMHLVSVRLS